MTTEEKRTDNERARIARKEHKIAYRTKSTDKLNEPESAGHQPLLKAPKVLQEMPVSRLWRMPDNGATGRREEDKEKGL
jgi:hypothetical protein